MNRLFSITASTIRKWSSTFANNLETISMRTLTTSITDAKSNINAAKELFRPLPPHLYNDESVLQIERENIFSKNWIYAGQLDRLQKPGDYLSITLAGYPIFLYRCPVTKDLVGFHNVCSHRAGPIVPINLNNHGAAIYGNQHLLKCHYHSWLFDPRDGSLKGTPNFGYKFKSDEKTCLSLRKINIEIFAERLVFVNLTNPQERSPFNDLFGDLLIDMMGFPLHEYRYFESQHHLIKCNWKTYIENYQEGYHISSIHPDLNKAVQLKQYTVTNKNDIYSVHYAPARDRQSDQDKFLWAYLYPNLAINLYEKGYNIEHILPISKDETMLSYEFFVRISSNESEMSNRIKEVKESIARTLQITQEDKIMCEQVQKNLNAGIYKPGYLSPSMENGVHLFQNKIKSELKHAQLKLESI